MTWRAEESIGQVLDHVDAWVDAQEFERMAFTYKTPAGATVTIEVVRPRSEAPGEQEKKR